MPTTLASLLLALVLLSGCAKESIVATVDPLCGSMTHICTSRSDVLTEGTASQIEGNNLAHMSMCKPLGDPCAAVRVKPTPARPAAVAQLAPTPAPATKPAAPTRAPTPTSKKPEPVAPVSAPGPPAAKPPQ